MGELCPSVQILTWTHNGGIMRARASMVYVPGTVCKVSLIPYTVKLFLPDEFMCVSNMSSSQGVHSLATL